jgi:hypothetical protein
VFASQLATLPQTESGDIAPADITAVVRACLLDHAALTKHARREGGLIAVRVTTSKAANETTLPSHAHFVCAHTTPSLGFGFMGSIDERPTVQISRKPTDGSGADFYVQWHRVALG